MTALSIALAGDCMVTRGALITSDPRAMGLRDLLHQVDFAFANLEVVPNDWCGYPVRDPQGGCLVAASSILDELAAAGVDVLGCAGNHALDMGVEGLLATIDALTARALPFAGIGRDLTEARMPVYVDRVAGSIALISCTSTFSPGHEAGRAGTQMRGRPGINPLRHTTELRITAAQLDVLRDIDRQTGLAGRRAEGVTLFGTDPANAVPGRISFLGGQFWRAETPGLTTACDEDDLDEISSWVRDARERADVVLVSVHAHEHGVAPGSAPGFLAEFAHRVIDEGADAVVGHGPHFLRGLELYKGKPIFFSVGNFASQLELADRVAGEDYAKISRRDAETPGAYFAARSDHGRLLFAPHKKYWQTILPVLSFDDRSLTDVCMYPISLGFGMPVHRRGRPRLADRDEAIEILDVMAGLSSPYGVRIEKADGEMAPVGYLPDLRETTGGAHEYDRRSRDGRAGPGVEQVIQ